jgi:serine kinase of HPr protein (carbohydrate metabolism regulator)
MTSYSSDTILSFETLHASCVAIAGRAVLIEGPSGAGKSDLALRLIDRGAVLVSDDYTVVQRHDRSLLASAPSTIAGKMEVRGLGIIATANVDRVLVALLIMTGGTVERMPGAGLVRTIAGIDVPLVALAGLEASAPIKVEMALAQFGLQA